MESFARKQFDYTFRKTSSNQIQPKTSLSLFNHIRVHHTSRKLTSLMLVIFSADICCH
jgi:hypothetical protein